MSVIYLLSKCVLFTQLGAEYSHGFVIYVSRLSLTAMNFLSASSKLTCRGRRDFRRIFPSSPIVEYSPRQLAGNAVSLM